MTRTRVSIWAYAVVALLLTVPATVAISRADSGIVRTATVVSGVPVTVLAPDGAVGRLPGVVVAHGFASSSTIMESLGVALARAGYVVAMPDFRGHGENAAPLPLGPDGTVRADVLQDDLSVVVDWLALQPEVDPEHLGLVGHSMGAGAVVRFAVADATGPQRIDATVAVSLPSADDVPEGDAAVPRDLLLMWGSAERPIFEAAGEEALKAGYPDGVVGQSYGSGADGTARGTVVVPGVEHIGIVFSPVAAQQMVDWLDSTVAVGSTGHTVAPDSKVLWLLVLLIGATVGFVPLARLAFGARRAEPSEHAPVVRARWVIPATVASALVASLGGALLVGRPALLPLSVADYTVVWFGVAGLVGWLITWWLGRRGAAGKSVDVPGDETEAADSRPRGVGRQVLATLALTAYLVAVLALASQHTWSDFAVVGARRWVLPVVEITMIVFFWADERLVARPARGRRVLLVTANRVIVVVALMLAVAWLGAPGVLILWVPLVALFFVLLAVCAHVVSGLTRERWAPAVVQAIPLAYVIASAFPLIGS